MATATETTVLEAQARTPGKKNDARRVRVGGKIPGVLYGAAKRRCRSRSIRGRSRVFCTPRPATTQFSSWLEAANAPRP